MCYLGTWIRGRLPRTNMAAQIIEIAPGLDIEPLTEPAAGREVAGDTRTIERIVVDATGRGPRQLRFLRTDGGLVAFLTLGLDGTAQLRLELEPRDCGVVHLGLIAIVVSGYDPAISFFVDGLGFELVEDSPSVTNDGRPKRWVVVRPPGAATPSVHTIALMSALLRGDWAQADAAERRHQVECSGLVAAYLQWHLEHSIRSLQHVEHA